MMAQTNIFLRWNHVPSTVNYSPFSWHYVAKGALLLLQGVAISHLQFPLFTPREDGSVIPVTADFRNGSTYHDGGWHHEHNHDRGA